MTDKKCPKCGSRNFQIVDYCITGYIYEVEDGVVIANGVDDGGDRVKTSCVCRECNHCWHPKKMDFVIDK